MGDQTVARELFDKVLESRGIVALGKRDPVEDVTLDRIDRERYKELIGEGQIWFNMKRRWQSIDMYDGQTVTPASDAVYIVPVPDVEKEYNGSYYEN